MKRIVITVLLLLSTFDISYANERLNEGKQLLRELKFKEAEQLFTKLITSDSTDAQVHYYYALTLYNLKKYNKSLAFFSSSIDLEPSSQAYRNRGAAYFNLGMYQDAIDDYDSAISLDSTDADAYYRRGHAYKNAFNDIVKALENYAKALKFDSTHAWAYVNRGNINLELGKYKQAVADYSNAVKYNEKISQVYYSRGTAYMKLAEYQNAINDFTETISKNQNFYLAYYYKGICLEAVGEKESAKDIYRKALTVTPASESQIIADIQKRLK